MAETVKIAPIALNADFQIYAGDTLEYAFSWLDSLAAAIPLSAYTALLQVKLDKTSVTSLIEITDLTGVVLTDAKPNVSITISDADMLTLAVNTPYFYDLQLTSAGGVVTTIMTGTIVPLQDNSR